MARPQRLRQDQRVEAEIQAGLRLERPAPEIYRRLRERFGRFEIPDPRTIRRRVAVELERRRDTWRPGDSDLDGAVLQTFAAVAATYTSVTVLSKVQGEALARVLHLAPALPPTVIWNFAHEYTYAGEDAAHIDLAIAFALQVKEIGRSPIGRVELGLDGPDIPRPSVEAHVRLHRKHWPERPFCAWAGGPSTWTSYMKALGFPDWEPEEENPRTAEVAYGTWWLWTARAAQEREETEI